MAIEVERFAAVPLFDELSPLEIADLLPLAETVSAKPGDVILQEGGAGDALYIISHGAFEVVKQGKQNTVLARLEEMSFFGEISLVTNRPCTASVICVEAGRLRKFSKEKIQNLLKADNMIAYKLIYGMSRILAERLAALDAYFATI